MKYKIILSDDNEAQFEPFKDIAFKQDVELICFTNWEAAESHLETEGINDFIGLILDGKGNVNEDTKSASSKHVTTATAWLNQQKAKGDLLPTIIYTAYVEDVTKFQDVDDVILAIEDKNRDFEHILKMLIANYQKDPMNRIAFKYSNVVNIFDDVYMPLKYRSSMLDVLTLLDSNTLIEKSNFNKIREIIEEMLRRAATVDPKFIPMQLTVTSQDGRPNLDACTRYLTGQEVDLSRIDKKQTGILKPSSKIMNDHVGWIFSSLTKVSSIISHSYSQPYTNFAYKSAVFGLCEVLLWFKDYCQTTYKFK